MIIRKYIECWESINTDNVAKLINCVDEDFYFSDPFVELQDKDGFETHIRKTLEKYRKLNFKILLTLNKNHVYLVKWNFELESKVFKPFNGISEIKVRNNLIKSHIDYWDPVKNIYKNIPVIGNIFKLLR
tara:strand:+ start:317 stop:706 length:390 start_codon:yes stop_codon:yes gene_type:complete